jgi:GPR1/FUN34/yaaH family
VRGPLTRQEVDARAASAQATIADPVPLGLAGFASARFAISTVYAGWIPFSPADLAIVIPVALIFGGVTSFLAGLWAFRRGNTLAATTFATFGAFNASWAILQWMMLGAWCQPSSMGQSRLRRWGSGSELQPHLAVSGAGRGPLRDGPGEWVSRRLGTHSSDQLGADRRAATVVSSAPCSPSSFPLTWSSIAPTSASSSRFRAQAGAWLLLQPEAGISLVSSLDE